MRGALVFLSHLSVSILVTCWCWLAPLFSHNVFTSPRRLSSQRISRRSASSLAPAAASSRERPSFMKRAKVTVVLASSPFTDLAETIGSLSRPFHAACCSGVSCTRWCSCGGGGGGGGGGASPRGWLATAMTASEAAGGGARDCSIACCSSTARTSPSSSNSSSSGSAARPCACAGASGSSNWGIPCSSDVAKWAV